MILEKIYNEFMQQTKLTDSVYKSVFANIGNILDYIKDIHWASISYIRETEEGPETTFFDLTHETPLYVIELFRNMFENFYELPQSVIAELKLSYAGVPYTIKTSGGITVFPEQIKFIKQYKLYELFIADTRVVDLFDAFDKCFSFINTFKTTSRDIYTPLLKRFENISAAAQILDNVISENKNAGTQLHAENINKRMSDIMEQLSAIKAKQETLNKTRKIISDGTKSYDFFIAERYKLGIEEETLGVSQQAYLMRIAEIIEVINKIDANLSDLNMHEASPVRDSEISFLIKKKVMFEREKLSQETSLKDISGLITDISGRRRIIVNKLTEIEQYSVNDLENIESELKRLDIDADKLYTLLLSLEAEAKHQKNLGEKNAINLAKGGVTGQYSDVTLQNIENANIIDHLAAPSHPTSVTTVANYLRYYFVYNATVTAEKLLTDKVVEDVYTAQALAVKLVLCRNFGIYFKQLFSSVRISDNRIEKLIQIIRN